MEKWKMYSSDPGNKEDKSDQSLKKIPVAEEHLRVGTQLVETGRVNISKKVSAEEVTLNVPVTQEEVTVERKEVNKYVNELPPASRQEGNTTILSVFKEVLVVEKKILLVEEVHITKRVIESNVPIVDTVRKEEVIVNRTPTGNKNN